MNRLDFRLAALFLGVLAVSASGCQRTEFTFYPVEGTVTKGGRPLRDIEVVFLADADAGTVGPRANGRTDEDGHYRLRTERGGEGAVMGKHRVLVFDLEATKKQAYRHLSGERWGGEEQAPPKKAKGVKAPLIPPSYGRINETPLLAEVGSQPLVFDIAIP
jgi:hypothetical protein